VKFPSSLRPGIIVALAAITLYAIPIRWIATRRLTPLFMPISVSDGHFRTGDFKINLDAVYVINFERSKYAGTDYLNCAGQARASAKLNLFKNGQPIPLNVASASNDFAWQRLDWFRAAPGTYSIDVEVLPGAECLNITKMRLVVEANDVNFDRTLNLLWGLCVFLGGLGIVLLIRSDPASFHDQTAVQHQNLPPISQAPGYSLVFRSQKRPPLQLLHGLSDFGIMHIATTLPLLIVFLFAWMSEAYSVGTYALIPTPHEIRTTLHSRNEPPRVWLRASGEFFLDEKRVPRDELRDAVRYELANRVNEIVYFGADGNPDFVEAVFAINEIRLAGGNVIWVTPKTSSELSPLKPVQ